MAKALVGSMRQVSIGPSILRAAAEAGVTVSRRHELGIGSKYMRGLGGLVLQYDTSAPSQQPQQESAAEQLSVEEMEKALVGASAAETLMAELVELDLDAETEEVALV